MRRFITFLLFLAGINMNAMGDTSCFTKAEPNSVDFNYTVLFEHDKETISDDTCKSELVKELKSIKLDRCKLITLIGSTDTTGSNSYNVRLGQRRVQYVKDLFDSDLQDKIIVFNGGESNAYYSTNDDTHYADERAVRILIVDKTTCDISNNDIEESTPTPSPSQTDISAALVRIQITNAHNSVKVAMKGIEDIQAQDLKISKWKDADGNFNTARLASDSIAGVVLGTAGGIITSSVVKKNQIKKGFEDISCTIGGQTVAGWGDTFTVGAK